MRAAAIAWTLPVLRRVQTTAPASDATMNTPT
jgi:hypothetical protein